VLISRREALATTAATIAFPSTSSSRAAGFAGYDGLGLAELVKRREVSPEELLAWATANAEAVNPQLNCLARLHYQEAKAQIRAGLPDGPFRGVPFLLKDLNVFLAGTVTSNGSLIFKDKVATYDSELVTRYKRAGLVILGKTTCPEFGLSYTTESKAFGKTRNPWNPGRTTGGSSGGSAAAVAAGVVPMAHGSDGGGSLRVPASCNGVFGLKPSRGRIPMGPGTTEGWLGCSAHHALTRSVRDSAALMDVSCGLEPGSRYTAPMPPSGSFLAESYLKPGKLRIALVLTEPSGIPIDPECLSAARAAAKLCEALGHHIEETEPVLDTAAIRSGFTAVVATSSAQVIRDRAKERGMAVTAAEVDAGTWWYSEQGEMVSGLSVADANVAFQRAAFAMAALMSHFDVVLSPTLAKPPVNLGELYDPSIDFPTLGKRLRAFSPFTAIENVTGQPAMSVPLYWSADNLPIGVMFTARYGEEAMLFRLASQLEEAQPWGHRRPLVAAT